MVERILRGVCPGCQSEAPIERAPFGLQARDGRRFIMAQHRILDAEVGPWCEAGANRTVQEPEAIIYSEEVREEA